MKNDESISLAAIKQVSVDYWGQYKKHPLLSILGFILPSIGTLLVFFVPPLIISRLVNLYIERGTISFTGAVGYIVLFGVLWLLGEALWRIGMYFMNKLKAKSLSALSKTAFRRMSARDYAFYTDNFSGALTKKGLSFSYNFIPITDILSYSVIGNLFQIVFACVVLWKYSMWLPIILVGSVVAAVLIAIPIIKKRALFVERRHQASSRSVGRLSDAITNMITVKSFAQEESEYQYYGKYADDFASAHRKAADYQNTRLDTLLSPLYVITNVLGLCLAVFFSSRLGLQAGAIVLIFAYYSQVTRIFWDINNVYRTLESAVTEAAEFTQLFVEPSAIQDTISAKPLNLTDNTIVFEGVTFGYGAQEGNTTYFLNDFNLSIKDNEKVGLVGPSGSGKTTITKLLLRFIDPQEGQILIGGEDIKSVTQNSLRETISYVPQEPMLFHRSLYENIIYGNKDASKEDVIKASKLAHAHDFINALPEGYDTMVGERGIKLSGGQRQRVAIARAILKKSTILILDEATSSLDSESEKYIQEGLWELMKGKTAVVIAHRLSTIKSMDRIIVLDGGKIAQQGTHDELIAKRGLYAKLWAHQSGEFLEE